MRKGSNENSDSKGREKLGEGASADSPLKKLRRHGAAVDTMNSTSSFCQRLLAGKLAQNWVVCNRPGRIYGWKRQGTEIHAKEARGKLVSRGRCALECRGILSAEVCRF